MIDANYLPKPQDDKIGELTPGIQRKDEKVIFHSGNAKKVQLKNSELYYRVLAK